MQIIGFHATPTFICRSDRPRGKFLPAKQAEILSWLLIPATPDYIKVAYNLESFAACICRMLGLTPAQCTQLFKTEFLILGTYRLQRAGRNFFAISQMNTSPWRTSKWYDIGQFLENGPSIRRTDSIYYAQELANEAQKTGQEVYDSLVSLNLHPVGLSSPITSFRKEILEKMNLPVEDDLPNDSIGEMFYSTCATGGWREVFQRGHFAQAWDYDRVCCYPFEAAKLPDFRRGTWLESKYIPENAYLGVADCTATINSPFSPDFLTVARGSERSNYTYTGEQRRNRTKGLIDLIRRRQIGTVDIHHGWWWEPKGPLTFPLQDVINDLYQKREASEGIRKTVIKRLLTGIYGSCLQTMGDKFGPLFNSVYGSETENNSRIFLTEWCMDNDLIPLSIAVDGILADKYVPCPAKQMGSMQLTGQSKALVISSGVSALQGKHTGRGLSPNYDTLVAQIKASPEVTEYTQSTIAPVTLGKCIAKPSLWPKLGQLDTVHRTIDVRYEDKRCYPLSPQNGGDLLSNQYASVPWDSSMLLIGQYEQETRDENTDTTINS